MLSYFPYDLQKYNNFKVLWLWILMYFQVISKDNENYYAFLIEILSIIRISLFNYNITI